MPADSKKHQKKIERENKKRQDRLYKENKKNTGLTKAEKNVGRQLLTLLIGLILVSAVFIFWHMN